MGYGETELNKYRNELNNHMDKIPNKYIRLWRTENNGQICQKEGARDTSGKWAIGNTTEAGDGEKHMDLRRRRDIARINTFIRPERVNAEI